MKISIAVPNTKLLSRQKNICYPAWSISVCSLGHLWAPTGTWLNGSGFLQRIAMKVSRHSCICCCCSARSFCCLTSCFCCGHIKFSRTFGCLSGNVLLNKLCFTHLTGNTKSRCFKGLCARVLIHGDGLTVIRCWGAGWTSIFAGESCWTAISCGRLVQGGS